MEPADLIKGLTRETKIRRDSEGRWFDGDDPLDQPKLSRAFDAWLERAPDGRYCLKNDINWAYVTIDGPPMFVRALRLDRDAVWITLSDGQEEALDSASLRQDPQGRLYCDVRDGSWVARFDRHAAAQLEMLVGEDAAGVFVSIAGKKVRPPTVDRPLVPLTQRSSP